MAAFVKRAKLGEVTAEAVLARIARTEHLDDLGTAMRFGANYPYGLFEWANGYGRDNLTTLLRNIASETGNPMYAPFADVSCAA